MSEYTTLQGSKLQHFYSISILDEGDTRYVYFNSTIHVNKRVKVGPGFSKNFSDYEILHDSDVYKAITNRYGSDIFACRCH